MEEIVMAKKERFGIPFVVMLIALLLIGMGSAISTAQEYPVLTTSAGQSADIVTLNLLCEHAGVLYDYSDVPNVDMVKSGVGLGGLESRAGFYVESYTDRDLYPEGTPFKTVLVAIGASLKGMGASGLSVGDEIKRLDDVLTYCKVQGMYIVGIHLGGVATRGAAGSDNERMIDVVAKYADHLVVTEAGNNDGRFEALGVEKNIEATVLKNAMQLIQFLTDLFE
jgi:hypothetical protein